MSQRSFANAEYALKKRTRRERLLDEIERLVPKARLHDAPAVLTAAMFMAVR